MSNTEYFYVSPQDIKNESIKLAYKIKPYIDDVESTQIIAIARGGLIPAQYISYILGIRNMHVINSRSYEGEDKTDTIEISGLLMADYENAKKIIIIDDIYDTGDTLNQVLFLMNEASKHFTDREIEFIPGVLYTQKKKKFMKNTGIFYSKKIKKINGVKPWVVFPWDNLELDDTNEIS